MRRFNVARVLFPGIFLLAIQVAGQSVTADEVITKHLQSIRERNKVVTNQVAAGLVQYSVLRKGGVGASGKIVIASEGNKMLLGMTFPLPSYPADTFVFDGKKMKVAFVSNNVRSYLGDYIYRYDEILKEGLIAGPFSTGWAISDLQGRKSKVDFEGSKKINDKEAYVLSYVPKKGSDLTIKLFFDATTFELVRSEYRSLVSSQVGSTFGGPVVGGGAAAADSSSKQREMRQIMIEDFSNYKKENGVNLPHSYKIYVLMDGAEGTREYEWKAEFSAFFFDQQLDPASFNTDSK